MPSSDDLSTTGFLDGDNHYYEARDCYTRHIEPEFREQAVHVAPDASGTEQMWLGDRQVSEFYFPMMDLFFGDEGELQIVPGALLDKMNPYKKLSKDERKDLVRRYREMVPAFTDRDARLKLMDEQGMRASLLFPSAALLVEEMLSDDPVLSDAHMRSFNKWIEDEWGYTYKDRLFAPAMISLLDLDRAIAELERVIAQGATVIHLKPGPVAGRSPADPFYDPFWARVSEAGLRVTFHLGHAGYERYSKEWSENPDAAFGETTAFQFVFCWCDRPIMETIAALITHNLFGRFPNIRVASVENGAVWVPYLVRRMDHAVRSGKKATWGQLEGLPSEIFRKHVLVAPHPEEKISRLLEVIGAESVIFGSDFPHAEGLPEPGSFIESALGDVDAISTNMIMRDNLAEFLNLSV